MFGRQWFSSKNQIGLSYPALQMTKLLLEHRFSEAADLAIDQSQIHPAYWRRQYKRVLHLSNRLFHEEMFGPLPLRVYFTGFWPHMDPASCQLLDLVRLALPEREILVINNPSLADISLFSCYGDLKNINKTEHSLRILFLGENVRPSYEHFDISLSSDLNTYCGLNGYLPLWLLEIDWFGKQYLDRKTYPLSMFTSDRLIDYSSRLSQIIYIGNNHEPYRMSLLHTIQRAGYNVQLYGSQSRPVDDKIELYSKYRFCFCPENSFFPGYVTEKVIHSYIAASIGIYWGCLDSQPFRDHPMIISLKSHLSDSELLHKLNSSLQPFLEPSKRFIYPRLFPEAEPMHIFYKAVSFLSQALRQFLPITFHSS